MFKYNEHLKYLPVLGPIDVATTATATAYIDLKEAHWATFVVDFGVINNSTVAVTLECSTAATSNATEQTLGFNYRKSAAVASDDMGAITAATTTGVTIAAADDNKSLLVEVDPSAVAAAAADMRFVRAVITPASDNTAVLVGAAAIIQPRFPGNDITSAT